MMELFIYASKISVVEIPVKIPEDIKYVDENNYFEKYISF